MTGENITIETLIRDAMESRLLDVHTCVPVIISKVNTTETVDVTVAVKRVKKGGELFTVPTLADVPVIFQGCGGYSISHSLKKGDEGIVLFAERDISKFIESGGVVSPIVLRKHEYSDAMFIPVSLSNSNRVPIPATGMRIEEPNGGAIEMRNGEVHLLGTVKFESVPGSGTADTTLNTHTHPTAAVGPPSPPTPGS